MNGPLAAAVITAVAGIFASALTFYLTRRKVREAEWRTQKLAHYKQFMAALNAIVGPPATTEERTAFADSANNIFLVGSPAVLIALRHYLDETAGFLPQDVPSGVSRLGYYTRAGVEKVMGSVEKVMGVARNTLKLPNNTGFSFQHQSGLAICQPA